MDYQLLEKISFVFLTGFLIKFFMTEFSKHGEERKVWADLFSQNNKAMIEHNERAAAFQCQVQEQHLKMIVRLEKMNEEHIGIVESLGRINGYKNDNS